MDLKTLNLVELNAQELQKIVGGGKWINSDTYQNNDGTWVYFGGNEIIGAGVALHNAAIYARKAWDAIF